MLSLSEIGNVNTVEHINFEAEFLASILNSVCFIVRYQLSSWSTQPLRKAAFVSKVYQSEFCYACIDQDFHLYLRAFTSLSSFAF